MAPTKQGITKHNQINIYGFYRKPQKMKILVIKINQNELEYVANFSRSEFRPDISWKPHLRNVSSKIVRLMSIMNKLKIRPLTKHQIKYI